MSLSLILMLILGSGLILILRILLSLVWHTTFVSEMRTLRVYIAILYFKILLVMIVNFAIPLWIVPRLHVVSRTTSILKP